MPHKVRIVRREVSRSLTGATLSNGAPMPEVLARIYAARKVADARELELSLQALLPAQQLKGIAQAADLLARAVIEQKRILIVGDFDADGATSCALAVRALRMMGAGQVDYLVPNRFEYGYGLTPEIVELAEASRPDVLITVDNGISSIEGVAAARRRGIQVVVTDHHLQGAQLPDADVIVNPNQHGDKFPSKALAGVGVIFYVMSALRTRLAEQDWFEKNGLAQPKLAGLLDLVALGTVADVVPLDRNNRIMVKQGLARIRQGVCSAGILALARIAGRDHKQLVAADLGFAIGPRLNAAGRLEDMAIGIECLLSDHRDAAMEIAQRLDGLNRERREIENDMRQQAQQALNKLHLDGGELPYGLCLYDDTWHQGVIGILASRIKERYHRPVIAFAPAGEGELKGSARSISGLHIRDALDAVAARHPDLLKKFGGHAMAAGMSLHQRDYPAFARAFDEEVRRQLSQDDLRGVIHSDGELNDTDMTLELAATLREAGPWGQAFPEPMFDGEFDIVSKRVVGANHLKMLLRIPQGDALFDAIAFNTTDEDWRPGVSRVRIAYQLDVNEYQGRRSVQLKVAHVWPL